MMNSRAQLTYTNLDGIHIWLGNHLPGTVLDSIIHEYTKNTACHTNKSYSKEVCCIAISERYRIGIDIEYLNCSFDYEIVKTDFLRDEKIKTSHDFYVAWTQYEAQTKMLGGGLLLEPHKYNPPPTYTFQYEDYIISLAVNEPCNLDDFLFFLCCQNDRIYPQFIKKGTIQ